MKTAMIIYEGVADRPVAALEDRTPMEVARCSFATDLAVTGAGGYITPARAADDNRPEMRLGQFLGMSAPDARALRRGPLEALGADLDVPEDAWVYRADFVTMDGTMLSECAVRRLSMEETEALTDTVRARVEEEGVELHVLQPGRVTVICRGAAADQSASVSPFDVEGMEYDSALPKRKHAFAQRFLLHSYEALMGHSINEVRVDLGDNPANALWPWGGGPALRPEAEYPAGVMATHCLMARGLAVLLGMRLVDLVDPWKELKGKREAFKIVGLVEALRENDWLSVYIEAPHAGGRYGGAAEKVWALESLDHFMLGPILSILDAHRPWRVLLTADGAVMAKNGRPVADSVPFIVAGEGVEPDGVGHWDEAACAHGELGKVRADEVFALLRKE